MTSGKDVYLLLVNILCIMIYFNLFYASTKTFVDKNNL